MSDQAIVELCDSDAKWGPLLFLRPERDRPLTLARVTTLSVVFGASFGALGNLVLEAVARAFGQPLAPWYSFPLTLIGLYFAASFLLLAPAWNRRAQRLARTQRFRG